MYSWNNPFETQLAPNERIRTFRRESVVRSKDDDALCGMNCRKTVVEVMERRFLSYKIKKSNGIVL